jgi:hypothetical protein
MIRRLKSAAAAAGLRPVLDPARPLATDMAAAREQETPVTHARTRTKSPHNPR